MELLRNNCYNKPREHYITFIILLMPSYGSRGKDKWEDSERQRAKVAINAGESQRVHKMNIDNRRHAILKV